MALAKVLSYKGLPQSEAYIAVSSLTLGKAEDARMTFSYSYHAVKGSQAFDFGSGECVYDLTGADAYAQAYEHLKTLPEFANATDC